MSELYIPSFSGETLEDVFTYLIRLHRTLSHQFMFIDHRNIKRLDASKSKVLNLDAGNITTGFLSADRIEAGSLSADKITAGQLVVGSNVGLGTAQDAYGVTTIIGNTVTTGYVNALGITVLGNVTAGSLTANTTIDIGTDAKIGNNLYIGDYSSSGTLKKIYFNSGASIGNYNDFVGFGIQISCSTLKHNGWVDGIWDFSLYSTVRGLEHSGYVKQSAIDASIAQHVADYHP